MRAPCALLRRGEGAHRVEPLPPRLAPPPTLSARRRCLSRRRARQAFGRGGRGVRTGGDDGVLAWGGPGDRLLLRRLESSGWFQDRVGVRRQDERGGRTQGRMGAGKEVMRGRGGGRTFGSKGGLIGRVGSPMGICLARRYALPPSMVLIWALPLRLCDSAPPPPLQPLELKSGKAKRDARNQCIGRSLGCDEALPGLLVLLSRSCRLTSFLGTSRCRIARK